MAQTPPVQFTKYSQNASSVSVMGLMEQIIGDSPAVIGGNTHDALRSGLIWGQLGAVHEIVTRMLQPLCGKTARENSDDGGKIQNDGTMPIYFLTGGAAPLLQPHLQQPFQTYPQLTLQGLGLITD